MTKTDQKLWTELFTVVRSRFRERGVEGFEGVPGGNAPLMFRWARRGGEKTLVPCLKMWRLAVILRAWRQGGLSDRQILERSWKKDLRWKDGKVVERRHLVRLRRAWEDIEPWWRVWFEREVWLRWPKLCAIKWVPTGPCSPERRARLKKLRRYQARKARNARSYRERKQVAGQAVAELVDRTKDSVVPSIRDTNDAP